MNNEDNFESTLLRAWNGELDFLQLVNCVELLEKKKLDPLAAVLYQTWLSRNQSPYSFFIYFNYGAKLSNLNDLSGAEAAFQQSIKLSSPAFLQPRLNLGMLYERMGEVNKAIDQWRLIEQNCWNEHTFSPKHPENKGLVLAAINNLARVMEVKRYFFDALAFLTKSLTLEPNQPDVLHHWVHVRQRQCLWPVYAPIPGVNIEFMKQSTSALSMLSITDDPATQLEAARRFVAKKVLTDVPALANPKGYQHEKLRVAYISSDFRLHAISLLTAELFELHDREHFEVYGFCWSPEDNSEMRQRVINGMDHFFRIHQLTDEAAARLIREQEIDILVNLQGQTSGARLNILSYRPAPIQITYLGLPATTGLPSIDYVIADRFLIPEDIAPFYSEKPLYMPDVYQVSDRKRLAVEKPSRESCGLPAESFVFCSFNNNFKYTPDMFDVWMNILRRTPYSVLWLLADNQWAQANLYREAEARGIDRSRLIFAPPLLPEHYRARFACADLFLDTFPFNAGATANEVLWMGLPILTCTGRSFASRMAGALLTAAKLDELITYNLNDYEEKAVWLANNPNECRRFHEQLIEVVKSGVLFDTQKFVRHLESSFKLLVAGL